jgi:hypothetical protein
MIGNRSIGVVRMAAPLPIAGGLFVVLAVASVLHAQGPLLTAEG